MTAAQAVPVSSLHLLMENIHHHGLVLLDGQGRVQLWSPGAEAITGFPATGMIGQPYARLYPREERTRRQPDTDLRSAARDGRLHQEGWRLRQDDSLFWACVTLEALPDGQGFTVVLRDATERKHRQDTLEEAAEHARKTFDSVFAFIAVLTPEGRVMDTNRAPLEAASLNREQVLGRPFADTPWWSHDAATRERLRQAVAQAGAGEAVRHDLSMRVGERGALALDLSLSPVRDAAGRVSRLVACAVDITERKQAELLLKDSEERFHATFDQAPVGIAHVGLNGRWLWVNRRLCELLGYSPRELMERTLQDLTFPDDLNSDRQQARQLLNGQISTYSLEKRYLRRDGQPVWTRLTMALARNQTGEPRYLIAVLEDIDQHQRAEQALSESEARLRSIVETAVDAIVVIDEQGVVESFNPAAQRLLGYEPGEVIGRNVSLLMPTPHRDVHDHYLAQYLRTGQARIIGIGREVEALRKDGARVPVALSVSEMRLATGRKFTGIMHDLRERKRAEEALRQANRQLENTVQELEQRNYEHTLLRELGDLLQTCLSAAEAYQVIGQLIGQLFPDDSGSLYILNEPNQTLEAMVGWGDEFRGEAAFGRDQCWALRRGRPRLVADPDAGLRCPHIASGCGGYVCAPLIAQGHTLGVLNVQFGPKADPAAPQHRETSQRRAITVAEHLALALANLRLRETLRQQAMHDALTGLYNRRHMEEALRRELRRCQRNRRPLGLIMADIDHFKSINDRHGHEAGDALLRALGELLRGQIRSEDVACRYGGEEFLLILPESTLETTWDRAETLRRQVRSLRLTHQDSLLDTVTLSLGVAVLPDHGATVDELVNAADAALYRAKAAGRDRVETAAP